MQTIFQLIGYTAAAIGVSMLLPQVRRILRHPDLQGVSPLAWGLMATGCTLWTMYGIRIEQPVQVFGNVLLVTGALTVTLYAQNEMSARRRAVNVSLALLAAFALGMVLPATLVGFLAFGLGMFSMVPQVATSLRTYRARTVSGVSLPSFGLRILSQLCWLTFAIGTRDMPVVVSAVVALSAALIIVILERIARGGGAVTAR